MFSCMGSSIICFRFRDPSYDPLRRSHFYSRCRHSKEGSGSEREERDLVSLSHRYVQGRLPIRVIAGEGCSNSSLSSIVCPHTSIHAGERYRYRQRLRDSPVYSCVHLREFFSFFLLIQQTQRYRRIRAIAMNVRLDSERVSEQVIQ